MDKYGRVLRIPAKSFGDGTSGQVTRWPDAWKFNTPSKLARLLMRPRIAVFGLPERTKGKLKISVHLGGSDGCLGNEVFASENDESGRVEGCASDDIDIDAEITVVIVSSGIVYYDHTEVYRGADISHVPILQKERITSDREVAGDWNIGAWREWDPADTHREGVKAENIALAQRDIVKVPIHDSYYYESRIDYTERFHKLWIGLNAYASNRASKGKYGDQLKILSLVDTPLSGAFEEQVKSVCDSESADVYRALQGASGLDTTCDVVRDEIIRSCAVFDFFSCAKRSREMQSECAGELNGIAVLSTRGAGGVFLDIVKKYREYMASESGMASRADMRMAFVAPLAPKSVERHGRILFHRPYECNQDGKLYGISDYFGSEYGRNPYRGAKEGSPKRKYEGKNPLFFRYLSLLYQFRCLYFHGDLAVTEQNNELARAAYSSLRQIYPAIMASGIVASVSGLGKAPDSDCGIA